MEAGDVAVQPAPVEAPPPFAGAEPNGTLANGTLANGTLANGTFENSTMENGMLPIDENKTQPANSTVTYGERERFPLSAGQHEQTPMAKVTVPSLSHPRRRFAKNARGIAAFVMGDTCRVAYRSPEGKIFTAKLLSHSGDILDFQWCPMEPEHAVSMLGSTGKDRRAILHFVVLQTDAQNQPICLRELTTQEFTDTEPTESEENYYTCIKITGSPYEGSVALGSVSGAVRVVNYTISPTFDDAVTPPTQAAATDKALPVEPLGADVPLSTGVESMEKDLIREEADLDENTNGVAVAGPAATSVPALPSDKAERMRAVQAAMARAEEELQKAESSASSARRDFGTAPDGLAQPEQPGVISKVLEAVTSVLPAALVGAGATAGAGTGASRTAAPTEPVATAAGPVKTESMMEDHDAEDLVREIEQQGATGSKRASVMSGGEREVAAPGAMGMDAFPAAEQTPSDGHLLDAASGAAAATTAGVGAGTYYAGKHGEPVEGEEGVLPEAAPSVERAALPRAEDVVTYPFGEGAVDPRTAPVSQPTAAASKPLAEEEKGQGLGGLTAMAAGGAATLGLGSAAAAAAMSDDDEEQLEESIQEEVFVEEEYVPVSKGEVTVASSNAIVDEAEMDAEARDADGVPAASSVAAGGAVEGRPSQLEPEELENEPTEEVFDEREGAAGVVPTSTTGASETLPNEQPGVLARLTDTVKSSVGMSTAGSSTEPTVEEEDSHAGEGVAGAMAATTAVGGGLTASQMSRDAERTDGVTTPMKSSVPAEPTEREDTAAVLPTSTAVPLMEKEGTAAVLPISTAVPAYSVDETTETTAKEEPGVMTRVAETVKSSLGMSTADSSTELPVERTVADVEPVQDKDSHLDAGLAGATAATTAVGGGVAASQLHDDAERTDDIVTTVQPPASTAATEKEGALAVPPVSTGTPSSSTHSASATSSPGFVTRMTQRFRNSLGMGPAESSTEPPVEERAAEVEPVQDKDSHVGAGMAGTTAATAAVGRGLTASQLSKDADQEGDVTTSVEEAVSTEQVEKEGVVTPLPTGGETTFAAAPEAAVDTLSDEEHEQEPGIIARITERMRSNMGMDATASGTDAMVVDEAPVEDRDSHLGAGAGIVGATEQPTATAPVETEDAAAVVPSSIAEPSFTEEPLSKTREAAEIPTAQEPGFVARMTERFKDSVGLSTAGSSTKPPTAATPALGGGLAASQLHDDPSRMMTVSTAAGAEGGVGLPGRTAADASDESEEVIEEEIVETYEDADGPFEIEDAAAVPLVSGRDVSGTSPNEQRGVIARMTETVKSSLGMDSSDSGAEPKVEDKDAYAGDGIAGATAATAGVGDGLAASRFYDDAEAAAPGAAPASDESEEFVEEEEESYYDDDELLERERTTEVPLAAAREVSEIPPPQQEPGLMARMTDTAKSSLGMGTTDSSTVPLAEQRADDLEPVQDKDAHLDAGLVGGTAATAGVRGGLAASQLYGEQDREVTSPMAQPTTAVPLTSDESEEFFEEEEESYYDDDEPLETETAAGVPPTSAEIPSSSAREAPETSLKEEPGLMERMMETVKSGLGMSTADSSAEPRVEDKDSHLGAGVAGAGAATAATGGGVAASQLYGDAERKDDIAKPVAEPVSTTGASADVPSSSDESEEFIEEEEEDYSDENEREMAAGFGLDAADRGNDLRVERSVADVDPVQDKDSYLGAGLGIGAATAAALGGGVAASQLYGDTERVDDITTPKADPIGATDASAVAYIPPDESEEFIEEEEEPYHEDEGLEREMAAGFGISTADSATELPVVLSVTDVEPVQDKDSSNLGAGLGLAGTTAGALSGGVIGSQLYGDAERSDDVASPVVETVGGAADTSTFDLPTSNSSEEYMEEDEEDYYDEDKPAAREAAVDHGLGAVDTTAQPQVPLRSVGDAEPAQEEDSQLGADLGLTGATAGALGGGVIGSHLHSDAERKDDIAKPMMEPVASVADASTFAPRISDQSEKFIEVEDEESYDEDVGALEKGGPPGFPPLSTSETPKYTAEEEPGVIAHMTGTEKNSLGISSAEPPVERSAADVEPAEDTDSRLGAGLAGATAATAGVGGGLAASEMYDDAERTDDSSTPIEDPSSIAPTERKGAAAFLPTTTAIPSSFARAAAWEPLPEEEPASIARGTSADVDDEAPADDEDSYRGADLVGAAAAAALLSGGVAASQLHGDAGRTDDIVAPTTDGDAVAAEEAPLTSRAAAEDEPLLASERSEEDMDDGAKAAVLLVEERSTVVAVTEAPIEEGQSDGERPNLLTRVRMATTSTTVYEPTKEEPRAVAEREYLSDEGEPVMEDAEGLVDDPVVDEDEEEEAEAEMIGADEPAGAEPQDVAEDDELPADQDAPHEAGSYVTPGRMIGIVESFTSIPGDN